MCLAEKEKKEEHILLTCSDILKWERDTLQPNHCMFYLKRFQWKTFNYLKAINVFGSLFLKSIYIYIYIYEFYYVIFFKNIYCVITEYNLPWYNRNGWLRVKPKVTYS